MRDWIPTLHKNRPVAKRVKSGASLKGKKVASRTTANPKSPVAEPATAIR